MDIIRITREVQYNSLTCTYLRTFSIFQNVTHVCLMRSRRAYMCSGNRLRMCCPSSVFSSSSAPPSTQYTHTHTHTHTHRRHMKIDGWVQACIWSFGQRVQSTGYDGAHDIHVAEKREAVNQYKDPEYRQRERLDVKQYQKPNAPRVFSWGNDDN